MTRPLTRSWTPPSRQPPAMPSRDFSICSSRDVADAHAAPDRLVDRDAVGVAVTALEVVVEPLVEPEARAPAEPQVHVVVRPCEAHVAGVHLDLDRLHRFALVRHGRHRFEPRERLVGVGEPVPVVAVDDRRSQRLAADPRLRVHVGVVRPGVAEADAAHLEDAQDDDPRRALQVLARRHRPELPGRVQGRPCAGSASRSCGGTRCAAQHRDAVRPLEVGLIAARRLTRLPPGPFSPPSGSPWPCQWPLYCEMPNAPAWSWRRSRRCAGTAARGARTRRRPPTIAPPGATGASRSRRLIAESMYSGRPGQSLFMLLKFVFPSLFQ